MQMQILIVEDHTQIVESVQAVIKATHPDAYVEVCKDAFEAKEVLARKKDWHRIVLDLTMPGAYGLSLALEVQKLGLAPVTIVMTGDMNRQIPAQVESMGFMSFVPKSLASEEMTDSLTRSLRGESIHAGIASHRDSGPVLLTKAQTRVLSRVRAGQTSGEIGRALGITEGGVNNHMTVIIRVLNANNRTHAIAKAIEFGLISVHPEDDDPQYATVASSR